MPVAALSALAASFPTATVEYDDLLYLPYVELGRFGEQGIDCLGVVLEIYRRAGLALPDVKASHPDALLDLLDEVPAADQLYDLVCLCKAGTEKRRALLHLSVVVRQGVALSAQKMVGVYTTTLTKLRANPDGLKFYRLKASAIPSV